jgi:Predicted Zn-dependent hydrolases of the beta-lactamase fold
MPKLLYQGHGSYRFTSDSGVVVYVDPFAGSGYDKPADIILVTHGHRDHNRIEMIHRKPDCVLITNAEALSGGKYNSFDVCGVKIEAVEARNLMHNPKQCVGFMLTLDGVKLYCSGDTSKTEQMKSFKDKKLDYAILCGDGVFNMTPDEAAECAELVGAKHNILVHMKPGALFDRSIAEKWNAPNKLIVEPGEEIEL